MTPKRQTLDGIGTRIRARTYADVYVPRRAVITKPIIDVAAPQKIQTRHMDISISQSANIAKKIVKPASIAIALPSREPQQKTATIPPVPAPQTVTIRQAIVEKNTDVSVQDDVRSMIEVIQANAGKKVEDTQKSNFLSRLIEGMFANKRAMVSSVFSLLLMVGGTVALISAFTTNHAVGKQVKVLGEATAKAASADGDVVDEENTEPSEEKIPEPVIRSYTAPADEPRFIYISKAKVGKTRVLKMGLDKNNAIKTPRNTWDAGWYDGSSKPNQTPGAALIVGHVSGLTGAGIFHNLYRLSDGDEIVVETGDGTKYTYKVVGKEEVPLDDINMNNYLVSKNIDKPGLTLMTCAGEYNPITKTYENRLAIFAVREN